MNCLRAFMLLVGMFTSVILALTVVVGLLVLFAWGIWNYPVYTVAGILSIFLMICVAYTVEKLFLKG